MTIRHSTPADSSLSPAGKAAWEAGHTGDASDLTFTPSGIGAVTRTVQDKERDTVSAFDFLTTTQISDIQSNTGSIDVSAGLIAAIAASKDVTLPPGTYGIASTLAFSEKTGIRFGGAGAGASGQGAVTIKWIGAALGVAIKLTGCRDCLFENFRVTVGAAPSTLAAGFDADTTGQVQSMSSCTFNNVAIIQRGGIATPDGSLVIGMRISRLGGPGNVSEFTYNKIQISGCSSAGISFEQSQARVHRFYGCDLSWCTRGITTKLNSGDGGGFSFYSGFVGSNTVADFELGSISAPILISGVTSESSNRFAEISGGAVTSRPVTIDGCQIAGISSLNADGYVIRNGDPGVTQGFGGPISVTGCDFYLNEAGTAAKISYNPGDDESCLIVQGCSFNNITPFGNTCGNVNIVSLANRGWNGSAYAMLPTMLGAFRRDVVTTDVVSTVAQTTVATLVVPAYTLGKKRKMRVTVIGDFKNNTGGALNNPAIEIAFGTLVMLSLASGTAFADSATRYPWKAEITLSAWNNQALQHAAGRIWFGAANVAGVAAAPLMDAVSFSQNIGGNPDGTVSQNLTVKITNANNNANYSTRKLSVQVELY